MTGFVLGLVFAAGVALFWAGAIHGIEPRLGRGRLNRLVRQSELPLSLRLQLAGIIHRHDDHTGLGQGELERPGNAGLVVD